MTWYDMIWYMVCDIWYDMIRYAMIYMIWCMMWYDMIYDMIWHDICYMIWHVMVYDMIYDIWYDIWYNIIYFFLRLHGVYEFGHTGQQNGMTTIRVPNATFYKHMFMFISCIRTNTMNIKTCTWRSADRASWYILITKPTRCTNFSNLFLERNYTCFGQYLCPSSGIQHCTHSNRYMSYRLCWLFASKQSA